MDALPWTHCCPDRLLVPEWQELISVSVHFWSPNKVYKTIFSLAFGILSLSCIHSITSSIAVCFWCCCFIFFIFVPVSLPVPLQISTSYPWSIFSFFLSVHFSGDILYLAKLHEMNRRCMPNRIDRNLYKKLFSNKS